MRLWFNCVDSSMYRPLLEAARDNKMLLMNGMGIWDQPSVHSSEMLRLGEEVKGVASESDLERIALTSGSQYLRYVAASRLTEYGRIVNVLNDQTCFVMAREAASSSVRGDSLLFRLACDKAVDEHYRKSAIMRIGDESMLLMLRRGAPQEFADRISKRLGELAEARARKRISDVLKRIEESLDQSELEGIASSYTSQDWDEGKKVRLSAIGKLRARPLSNGSFTSTDTTCPPRRQYSGS